MSTEDYSTMPAVPLTGVKPGTTCVRRNGNVCRLIGFDGPVSRFDVGPAMWTDNGRMRNDQNTPSDIVRIVRETPLPDGWRVDGEWLVCGDAAAFKSFPDGSVIVATECGNGYSVDGREGMWFLDAGNHATLAANIAAVDEAYAAHVAEQSKPLLGWLKSDFFWESEHDGWQYLVGSCETHYHERPAFTAFARNVGIVKWLSPPEGMPSVDAAKAACEQHARSNH